jgi:transcriptional regulator with XRE-family HTH domain
MGRSGATVAERDGSLGEYLRALRRAAGLTLRQVQGKCALGERCGVSNGYLSLLEHDHVKAPNPNVLFTLAECYGADYAGLLRRAGYPLPTQDGNETPTIIFAGAEQLTAEEREEIQEIIALKLRRRRPTPPTR